MTTILDQQLVAHLYAPTDGPDAGAAYRALREIWRYCRLSLHMTEPIPGIGLPNLLPETPDSFPAGGEVALAAQERPGADCQAVLRRHHDLFNLSIALAPPEATAPDDGDWPWWRMLDLRWDAVLAQHGPHLVGEARLYLARVGDEAGIRAADPALYDHLNDLLPEAARGRLGRRGVSASDGLALWETVPAPDERPARRFLLAIAPDADPAASAWVWSRGDTAIPPLARYLLHAAKIRYELRVWLRDGQARHLRDTIERLATEMRRLGAGAAAQAELLRLRRMDALMLHTDLRALRHTVDIAADNLGRAFDLSALMAPSGPFADDAGLARSLLERLDDELAYLAMATDRATHLTTHDIPVLTPPATAVIPPPPAGLVIPPPTKPEAASMAARPSIAVPLGVPPITGVADAKNVFVVYGRDEPVRQAVFTFLRALDLRPLQWEDLVKMTGKPSPFLGEVVARSMLLAQAVVVVMTPEDVVHLHPDLHEPQESSAEARHSLQARPNVLLELGMALAVHPDRTLILLIGDQRPVTDLGGRNYVRVTGTPDFRVKIANRLRLAGCPVDTTGTDWLTAGDFTTLTAHNRTP
ncbi:hypothetical protein Ssi03_69120 [Sphaerisporangium siamense]|uniref:Cell division protein ZapA (FtsZ GTPase activity inhibitor) n=1 Tax=Sphaerisporangium siamense TaxID=795645 RepID=A0A7W7D801_9ACTN|nr:CATRA conflict system CASPASE/TPR repeat-associated protein [Sphaerisporangium siamense]MBB4700548.1 cell division protein ZapA (FtsZ GTPase activity inhibitor) [Sphaerisporangium siamense]GII88922.1 hypothetical protein Ssi03_69120 [Sphaerisporangium siamense]